MGIGDSSNNYNNHIFHSLVHTIDIEGGQRAQDIRSATLDPAYRPAFDTPNREQPALDIFLCRPLV